MHRLDLDAPPNGSYWDVGVEGGVTWAGAIARGLESGVRAAVVYFPKAGTVTVPNGPSVAFNNVALQLSFFIAVGGGG